MASVKRFEDLFAWQKARLICQQVNAYTKRPDFSKDFKFRDQIRSSSGSVMDNIAEGFGRKGNLEFRNFLTIANGSLMETKSQLMRAFDHGYISEAELEETVELIEETGRIIHALVIYLGKSSFRGMKYNSEE